MKHRNGSIVLFAMMFVLVFTRQAYGYIDPGTGSFILQLAIGSLLGAALAVKLSWARIKFFLGSLFRKRNSDEN